MVRVLSVVGNRPQFIKAAPLSLALREAGIDETVVHTGQHWDPEMSQVFFDELGLPEPQHKLDLHTPNPEAMAAPIRAIVEVEQPDWVIVMGDTNSTLAGALAAGERPIAHVEAGLRSFDLSMPEERNRIEVDRRSALLLTPDERASKQLESEGVQGRNVVVGDVMADATRLFTPLAAKHGPAVDGAYSVLTLHREANTQPERLGRIVDALNESGTRFVFPVHPRTRLAMSELGLTLADTVEQIEPLGYLAMLALVGNAERVVTDSGGLQKEAYWLHVPCVTIRPSTEWVDTVAVGANALTEPEALADAIAAARFPDDAPELYGDGHAAERIASALYA
jgi:UDP-N-acetylglucosamine 2-epimerase